ncbi:MAG: DUF6767 domain-containing protein [Candidatus Nanopelagicales bacterium]
MRTQEQRSVVAARCPLRSGEPCTLCHPDARTGPQDCPTVALVMDDEQMREEFAKYRREHR